MAASRTSGTISTVTETALEESMGGSARWGLTVLWSRDGAAIGRRHVIEGSLGVGRVAGNGVDVVISDPLMSRHHATFSRQGGTLPIYAVVDHGSKNGTFANGAKVSTRYLEEHTVLRLGGTLLEFGRLEPDVEVPADESAIVGRSAALREALGQLDRVADKDVIVLVSGESGTGKELAAARLHEKSGRTGRFVAVNCGAIPAGLMESYLFGHKKGAFTGATSDSAGYFATARDGTLFLDEIGELPLDLQPKLLRVLETRELYPVGSTGIVRSTARVVAATNVDLRKKVEEGTFRLDLLARLQEVVVTLPPLRARHADVVLLTEHFLRTLAPGRAFEWTPDFVEGLLVHDWPMNVRELRSVVQRIALLHEDAGKLTTQHLPPELAERLRERPDPTRAAAPPGPADRRKAPPREELESLLALNDGNIALVGKALGKDRKQIYRWIQKYDLDPESYREP